MATTPISAQVAQAFNRFGLGARPTDPIPPDINAWLTSQLSSADPLANGLPSLKTCLGWANAVFTAPPHSAKLTSAKTALEMDFATEVTNFMANALVTATPFRERLVWFWANHFAIQAGTTSTIATAGAFVREAIRPYVTGNFADMLLAVIQHPAMLCSLNNDVSVGPNSILGLATGEGINENLARETLELYSVGVGAGYTQDDVDSLAYILTGWTVSYSGPTAGFIMTSTAHQPGQQTLMGVTYPGNITDGIAALQFLGTHPATYNHMATKLVTHFISDTPDPDDVAAVAGAMAGSGGNLTAAMTTLIALPNAWLPLSKIRTPLDHVVATARALGAPSSAGALLGSDISHLDEIIWVPPFPNGWPDTGADWASPAQMMLRTNWVNGFTRSYPKADPASTANLTLGALLNPATTSTMAQVSSQHDKLTILFTSPEFQRR